MTTADTSSERELGQDAKIHDLGSGCYAISAEGCPNTGVIVGERGLLVIDAQPTEELGEIFLKKIREISDKPIKVLLLTHFHGDSTAGAAAFEAGEVIASDLTKRMMETRGLDDREVLKARYPDFYPAGHALPALAMPTMTIASSMSIDLGGREVRLMHLGRGHTMGDLVVWVSDNSVLYAGGLVQSNTAPYCGDAHLADWPRALDRIMAFRPSALVPGHGRPAIGSAAVATAIETTRDYVVTLRDAAAACAESKLGLHDTFQSLTDALQPRFGSALLFDLHLPFNVARAYDEAQGLDQPQIWTRERCDDLEDALTRTSPVSPKTEPATLAEDEPVVVDEMVADDSDADVEQDTGESADTVSEASGELVTDSDFAASLLAGSDEAAGEDELLPEEDVVQDEKVLEKAGA